MKSFILLLAFAIPQQNTHPSSLAPQDDHYQHALQRIAVLKDKEVVLDAIYENPAVKACLALPEDKLADNDACAKVAVGVLLFLKEYDAKIPRP